MRARWFLLVLLAYFSLVNTCEAKKPAKQNRVPAIVSRLFKNKSKPPIIFYFEPQSKQNRAKDETDSVDLTLRENDYDDDNDVSSSSLRESEERSDEGAYILYNLLRTTLQIEDLDPSTANELQYSKLLLRQALRRRCKKLDSCVKKCPKKKKWSCTVTCKQIFDNLNACKPPKNECERPKCGKTMPPSWIL